MSSKFIRFFSWKYISIIILAVVCIFSFVSCATSKVPEPGENCRCLLVLCTDLEISGAYRQFSYLKLAIRGVADPIDIIPSKDYIIVSNLKPGTYTTESITQLQRLEGGFVSNTHEKPKPEPFKLTFTLESGKITIFPVLFIYLCKETPGGVRSGWNLDNVTPEIREKRILSLKKSKSFSYWELQ